MTSNGRTRLYDRLTPRERLPLILAASARGDEAERERLGRAAPTVAWRVRDYFGLAMAFREVSEFAFMELLNVAALYLGAWGVGAAPDTEEGGRALDRALMLGFLFKTKLAGWRRFCQEQNLDPMLCWSVLPGYDTLRHAERAAETAAFVPEGAARFLARIDATAEVPTPEAEAKSLRECLEARAEWWG